MIFVDTGAWFAAVVSTDVNHNAATAWLRANREPLFTTDFIIDETLTLLRIRRYPELALDLGQQFFDGPIATVHYITPEEVAGAWEIFRRFTDKRWSFTDCTSKLVIESLGIEKAFSFDEHFRQFGTVIVAP